MNISQRGGFISTPLLEIDNITFKGPNVMNFGILVLLLALILFGLLAFKQISALILAPLVTIFVLYVPVCQSSKV